MKRIVVATVMSLVLVGGVWAQTPKDVPKVDVPTMSESDSMKLTNYGLLAENLALKIQALQSEQAKMQTEVQTFVRSLEKPGFHLERDVKGAFIYVANPPEKK